MSSLSCAVSLLVELPNLIFFGDLIFVQAVEVYAVAIKTQFGNLAVFSPFAVEKRAASLQEVANVASIARFAVEGECVAVFKAFDGGFAIHNYIVVLILNLSN